jgi:hypothetical protein
MTIALPTLLFAQQSTPASSGTTTDLSTVVSDTFNRMNIVNRPETMLESLAGMPLILAAVLVVLGILCVINGYRWHRWVVIALALLLGAGLGHIMSGHVGKSSVIAAAAGILCAVIATPMLRVTVAVFGGLSGAFIGTNAWAALATGSADLSWAGAAMGFIILALASFILFRLTVVTFTSVGGGAMIVLGLVCILMQVPAWQEPVRAHLASNHLLVPILVAMAGVMGIVLQESKNRAGGKPAGA